MTVEDDFGAGIEATPANTAPAGVVADTSSPAPDEFMTQFRGLVDGIPDGITRDQVADFLVDVQAKASRAEELERQNAEYQAQIALVARKGTTESQEVADSATPPVVDEYELPWKPVKVDPQYRGMVRLDPEAGGYIPKNPASPVHLAAAEEMNRRAQYERQFADDLFDDPEAAIAKLSQRQLAKIQKEFDEKLAKLSEQFQPIQQATEQAKAEQEFQGWIDKNSAKLFAQDGNMTPVGTLVDQLLRSGKLTQDEALTIAESTLTPATPAAAKPSPATPPATPKFTKPNRLVDDINVRHRKANQPPPSRSVYDGGSGKWKKSWEDLEEQVVAMHGD